MPSLAIGGPGGWEWVSEGEEPEISGALVRLKCFGMGVNDTFALRGESWVRGGACLRIFRMAFKSSSLGTGGVDGAGAAAVEDAGADVGVFAKAE